MAQVGVRWVVRTWTFWDPESVSIRVAVGQTPTRWDVAANVQVVESVISEVDSGSLLVLPEAALSGYDDTLSGLDDLDPATLADAYAAVAAAATAADVHVVCGSLLHDAGRWWNAGLYFSPGGDEPWIYRKVNLATHERGRLAAGSHLPTVHVGLPDGPVQVGVQLCREILYAEQWHCLARDGAQLLLYLTYAANADKPAGVWRSHLISRAAETQRYVIAANVADRDQHCPTMIISPTGEVLEEAAGPDPMILGCELDLNAVSDWYVTQQRADVVSIQRHAPQ